MSLAADARPVVFILTRDRAVGLAFYRDVLGLPLLAEDPFAATFHARGVILRLTNVEGHIASPHPVMGWDVPDIETGSAALAAKGEVFTPYPVMTEGSHAIWSAPDGRVRLNWFPDPEGNRLSQSEPALTP